VSIVYPSAKPTKVEVRFRSSKIMPIEFDRFSFKAAYQAIV